MLESEGWEALQPELNMLSKSGRWEEMPVLIDDGMLVPSPRWIAQGGGLRRSRPIGGHVGFGVGFYTPYLISEENNPGNWLLRWLVRQ